MADFAFDDSVMEFNLHGKLNTSISASNDLPAINVDRMCICFALEYHSKKAVKLAPKKHKCKEGYTGESSLFFLSSAAL